MTVKSLMKNNVLLLFAMAIVSFPYSAEAKVELPYELPTGPVTLYGQELNPYLEFYDAEDYNGYRWDQIRNLAPEVFPDAKENTLSATEVCDLMVNVSDLYNDLEEENFYRVVNVLKPKFPDINDDTILYDKVAAYLEARDPDALNELLALLPDYEFQVLMTRKLAMKNKAITMLHDAALANCPEHAAEKGYRAYTAPDLEESAPEN